MAKHLARFPLPIYAEEPAQGIARWVNPQNQCQVLLVHYTADPDRRSVSWRGEAVKGYTEAAWNQEQELDFSSWGGMPVYGAFSSDLHVAKEPIVWSRRTDWPMIRAWDIGTHACVWAQLQRTLKGERLKLFTSRQTAGAFPVADRRYERYEIECSGLAVFVQECVALSERWFKDIVEWQDVIDPAAFNRTITKTLPPSSIFQTLGLNPVPGRTQDITIRVSAVEDWLSLLSGGEPALQVDPQAQLLIDAFDGGYHWCQIEGIRKPDKGAMSHVMNAIEYLCTVYPSPKSVELRRQEQRKQDIQRRDYGRRFPVSASGRSRGEEQWAKINW